MTAIANDLQTVLRSRKSGCALAKQQVEVRAEVQARVESFQEVRALDEKWSQLVQDGSEPFDKEVATELYAYYQAWYDSFAEIDDKVRHLKEKGRNIIGAADHRNAAEEVRVILRSISLEALIAEWN